MPDFVNAKVIVIAVLFLVLVVAKVYTGNRPWDPIARRPRRFGPRGTMSPARDADAARPRADAPEVDPEEEFFKRGE